MTGLVKSRGFFQVYAVHVGNEVGNEIVGLGCNAGTVEIRLKTSLSKISRRVR